MESMGKKRPRPRRSLTPEFKAEIVELCRQGDRTVGQVAKDFDLTVCPSRSAKLPSSPDDEDPVGAFATYGADPALRE